MLTISFPRITRTATAAAIATVATLNAVAILAFAPKSHREKEIARAKRNVAERKAQMAARRSVSSAMSSPSQPSVISQESIEPAPQPKPTPAPAPTVPDPWVTPRLFATDLTLAPHSRSVPPKRQLCLPAAKFEPTPAPTKHQLCPTPTPVPAPQPASNRSKLKNLTIRELKAKASTQKIRGYGKMTKSQLIAALA